MNFVIQNTAIKHFESTNMTKNRRNGNGIRLCPGKLGDMKQLLLLSQFLRLIFNKIFVIYKRVCYHIIFEIK